MPFNPVVPQVHPMRVKKLYVLAALEIDKFKKRTLEMNPMDAASTMMGTGTGMGATRAQPTATMAANAAQTLAGLMTLEAASMADTKVRAGQVAMGEGARDHGA